MAVPATIADYPTLATIKGGGWRLSDYQRVRRLSDPGAEENHRG
nr:MAG TPA: hypothetical protein [Caudoviricetes sp.]